MQYNLTIHRFSPFWKYQGQQHNFFFRQPREFSLCVMLRFSQLQQSQLQQQWCQVVSLR